MTPFEILNPNFDIDRTFNFHIPQQNDPSPASAWKAAGAVWERLSPEHLYWMLSTCTRE